MSSAPVITQFCIIYGENSTSRVYTENFVMHEKFMARLSRVCQHFSAKELPWVYAVRQRFIPGSGEPMEIVLLENLWREVKPPRELNIEPTKGVVYG